MIASKSSIDKAGRALAGRLQASELDMLEYDQVVDEYRKSHLQPLSEITSEIQQWLTSYESRFYLAQRLKRKPQIVRKLKRLSVRLTQLQDIGGCRVIVDKNSDVEKLIAFLSSRFSSGSQTHLIRTTDYRQMGRDDSGYRAIHMILERSGVNLELQIRSRIQHYWSESIERTSVIYGNYLKELEGDPVVIGYFKSLSDIFFDIESGRKPLPDKKLKLAQLRNEAESIILESDSHRVFDSFVNEGIVKTLIEKEKHVGTPGLNNWIIVFDWNTGSFASWDIVERDPDIAIHKYVEFEGMFPAEKGFEVVLIGSSEVATIRETHSHYFGIEKDADILESLDQSIVGFSRRMDIDVGARQILLCLYRKHFWGKKTIAPETLQNHYCQSIITFGSSLNALVEKGLVHRDPATGAVALDIKKKKEIEHYL